MSKEMVVSDDRAVMVSQSDVDALKAHRALLKTFIKSQLVEANFKNKNASNYGEGDYGVIEGTKQKSLLKPGSEKLQRLFKLGCKFEKVSEHIDFKTNEAWFNYKCKIHPLNNPSITIAECDAMISSQEKKYKERTEWFKTKSGASESRKVPTPIADILNTLVKMCQKRAMVGATIIATSASDFFTQDMLDEEDLKSGPAPQTQSEGPSERDATPPAEPSQSAPQCCGKSMMISKYGNRDGERKGKKDWYCLQCKTSQPREPQS